MSREFKDGEYAKETPEWLVNHPWMLCTLQSGGGEKVTCGRNRRDCSNYPVANRLAKRP